MAYQSTPTLFVVVRISEKAHTRVALTAPAARDVLATGIKEDEFNCMGVEMNDLVAAALTDERRAGLTALRDRMLQKLGSPVWVGEAAEAVAAYQNALANPERRTLQQQRLGDERALAALTGR